MAQVDEYQAFAEHYDYIFPDWPEFLDTLAGCIYDFFRPHGVDRVLDCACGTGVPSIL